MPENKRYIKVKSVCQGSSCLSEPDSEMTLPELLDGAPPGEDDGYVVSIVEMTEKEFKDKLARYV